MGKLRKKTFKPPKRIANIKRRSREYLTPNEIEKILNASKQVGRYGTRDHAMLLIAYRHALRVSELIALKWSQIDLKQGLLHVNRLKNGITSTHPLFGPELRALRIVKRNYPGSEYVFMTERKSPITDSTFRKIALLHDYLYLKYPCLYSSGCFWHSQLCHFI